MFPNPQDALPLPPRPSLERYRKLAKALVKAFKSGDPDAIGRWAERWIESLATAVGRAGGPAARQAIDGAAGRVAEFAARALAGAGSSAGRLADAQFVLARSHGFQSWPRFLAHLDRLAHADTDVAAFEAAADAIVAGDEAELRRLLAADRGLVHVRSSRQHRATLLHYVSANGVESYRQRTPPNIVAITRMLLEAGAEVDAEADVYGGGATALGLVATSAHPRAAGVQIPLAQLLLDHGAQIERPGAARNAQGAVLGCLANGCPEVAAYLAERGAALGVVEAAGLGRLDVVRRLVNARSDARAPVAPDLIDTAFRYACRYGRTEVVALLIERGVDLAGRDGDGQTGLHYAVMGGHLETIRLLLKYAAPLEALNTYGGTVLGQTLWSAAHGGDPDVYVPIIETLIAAGAQVPVRHPPVNAGVDAALRRYGSAADGMVWWYGERPSKRL